MPIFLFLAYVIVLLLSVSISGYLSYEGLLKTAGDITLPLVVFLMIIILSMDATISYFRSTDRNHRLPIFIWIVAAFFSIASNFNFLYSNFMRDDVTQSTVTAQLEAFRNDLVATRTSLSDLEIIQYSNQMLAQIDVELDNLYNQINDPLRPGCGDECQFHMANIERFLGKEVTNIFVPPIGSEIDVVNEWYERWSSAAQEILRDNLNATQYPVVTALNQRIREALLRYDTVARVMASEGGLHALPEMADLSLDIEREANALLPEGDKVKHRNIDPTLGRLGEIVYAFQNGFGEMPNPVATFVSLVLASVVDILPFLLAFALFGSGRLEKNVKTGTLRSKGGRRTISS